jgi:hypothetical protein
MLVKLGTIDAGKFIPVPAIKYEFGQRNFGE